MSSTLVLLLESDRIFLLGRDGEVASFGWSPDDPSAALAQLRARVNGTSQLTVVVGIGLLEVARPELPSMPASTSINLLLRDSDRYFPVGEALAVSYIDGYALGVSARQLHDWTQTFSQLGQLRAVVTIAGCLARAAQDTGEDNRWLVPAGSTGAATIVVNDGVILELSLKQAEPSPEAVRVELEALTMRAIWRGAVDAAHAPLTDMLLDESIRQQLTGARHRRFALSTLALAAALAAFGVSLDRWRARELAVTDSALQEMDTLAAPARLASARLETARGELALLASASGGSPAKVLARLGELLPSDAFVQGLEWNGETWQINGSAQNAPSVVPLLDADPMFSDVRIVAASSRFLDAGRQRESFSISFRTRITDSAQDSSNARR